MTYLANQGRQRAFTLIELVVVVTIIAIMGTLIAVRAGVFNFWREEGFLRRLSETITFLHYQATVDRLFYEITFDLKGNSFSVAALNPIKDTSALASGDTVGALTLELADLVSPALGVSHTANPPPDFPSLAEPVKFPDGMILEALHSPERDTEESDRDDTVALRFSPRGIVDGAVLAFRTAQGNPINMVVNPFTGLSTIHREEVDFEAILGTSTAESNEFE